MVEPRRKWWLNTAGGPLCEAADRFVAWQGGAPGPGPDAVRWLVHRIDDFAHDESAPPSDDDRFVEGAGAFLGMVFVDRRRAAHSQRGTDHRILLGDHGSFDPFGAIDAALDADEPSEELRARLLVAEAEVSGEGPTSRIVRCFAERLSNAPSPRAIARRFDLEVVTDDGIEVDLGRLVAAAEDGGALEDAASKLVSLLPGNGEGSQALTWEEAGPRLLPRLVPTSFLDQLKDQDRGQLAYRALSEHVAITLQVRFVTRSRYLREDELQGWPEDSYDRAIANLAHMSASARFASLDVAGGPLIVARTGDGLDSARLLLPTLAAVLEPDLGSSFLVAAPHRDALIAAPDTPSGQDLLKKRAADLCARAPHAISPSLFCVSPEGLRPVA